MQKLFLLFITLLIAHSNLYSQQEISSKNTKTEFSVLFIGNSLTFTNSLPQLVAENAKLKGIEVHTELIALPNYSIEDHWNDGKAQVLISNKKYDFVILQQGPSSQSNGRKMLIKYGKKYSKLCKLNESKLCYFMVWPSLSYYHTFDNVIKNYKDAASINNSILLPVGEIWKDYVDSTEENDYYSSDGFHPSVKGSQIAAKVIVEHLFQE
ncbi:SGNH/GDSL hydrolase family protein [Bizionia argentinensis JUB59]|uniref:SGNH/GDSL hydrolase family protein n=1 Tax=Bizionia argentinensis JUB59 TaxID=1046627 RepID=G2EAM4_9FLAO|nr:SGNH/GDSL hydrolase family protein [Bizionia argentinensis]EGV44515.1 SGNH/GDSL hydrolase family protein [Bizionia argentinensis JUB59]